MRSMTMTHFFAELNHPELHEDKDKESNYSDYKNSSFAAIITSRDKIILSKVSRDHFFAKYCPKGIKPITGKVPRKLQIKRLGVKILKYIKRAI